MRALRSLFSFLVLMIAFAGHYVSAQDQPKGDEKAAQKDKDKDAEAQKAAEEEPKPYDKVITGEVKTKPGIFIVHRIKNRVYYEIPVAELGKDFLWTSRLARTPFETGYGGQEANEPRVVRWERRENHVLLLDVSYDVVAKPNLPIARGVEAANSKTILMAFNIAAFGKNETPVIEVTKLFTTEVPEFSAKQRLGAGGFDPSRTFFERVAAYPTNIEVEATQTFTLPFTPPNPLAPPPPPRPSPSQMLFGGPMKPGSATVLMHYSMVKLPDNPMMPRLSTTASAISPPPARLQPRGASRAANAHTSRAGGSRRRIPVRRCPSRSSPSSITSTRRPPRSGSLDQARSRGLAAGFRGGRVQERHHRQGSAHTAGGSRTGARKTRATP